MQSPKVTPKDFFFWLGAIVGLYASVGALIALLFQYINYAFPDPLAYYSMDPFSSGIRFSMATLIVMVPVTLFLFRLIRQDIVAIPEKAELWVRRWALVLTVFIFAAVMVGDLITLINYFLGGELTTRFILKVLVVLLVAGGVFLHFLADLRGYWLQNAGRAQMVGYAAGALVIASIVAGFFIMGTPGEVRLIRYDAQKVADLQNIQYQVVNYWQQKQMLPQNLDEIYDPISGMEIPKDPQSMESYRYEKTGDMTFKLCATFNTEVTDDRSTPIYDEFGKTGENWRHSTGEVCFDRTIDPDRYPPFEKPIPVVR